MFKNTLTLPNGETVIRTGKVAYAAARWIESPDTADSEPTVGVVSWHRSVEQAMKPAGQSAAQKAYFATFPQGWVPVISEEVVRTMTVEFAWDSHGFPPNPETGWEMISEDGSRWEFDGGIWKVEQ